MNDAVYLNKLLTAIRRKDDTVLAPDASVKLRPKKSGPYCVVLSKPRTVIIDVHGIHNVVAVDRITFAKAANEEGQNTKKVSDDISPATESTILNDRQDDVLEVEAENVVPRERSEHKRQLKAYVLADKHRMKGQSNHDDTKSQVEPTDYVVDRIVDHRDNERLTLHGVR